MAAIVAGPAGILRCASPSAAADALALKRRIRVTGKQVAKRVTHLWVHHDDLTELVLNVDADDDGVPDRLVTTEDHPFWNATEGAWEGPEEFAASDEVIDEQ